MALTIGTQLGSMEVTALIGRGGMGEVYRARDTKLKRDVAIKILPDEFSRDADRVSRFQREAEVLASLNHPNIGAIYDLQKANGSRYLVLELVEGETLADRIARGPIPVEEALEIAKNICEALEAAHEKGITHRDLKPANVKITPEGKVKVLDFGLAKAMSGTAPATTLSNSPTLVSGSMGGAIIGTAAYMSPEQAKGREADQRSDVFAFGCVLYEMLTGRQSFQGEDVSDLLASVLKTEVDFNLLPRDLNPRIREMLYRCLEKDVKKRWQAAGDLRVEIETALTDPRGLKFQAAATATQWPRWRLAAFALVSAILGGVIVGVTLWGFRPGQPREITRFPLILPDDQRFSVTTRQVVAISPDGKNIVYTANRQMYLRRLSDMASRPIPGTDQLAASPFFSPDGEWIAFNSVQDSALKKIAITGGAAVTLCPLSTPVWGGSWEGDLILFSEGQNGIFAVPASGGKPELWVKPEPGEVLDSPQLLPGGEAVLFSVAKGIGTNRWDKADIVAFVPATRERKVLIQGGGAARYVPTGHLVYALGANLVAVPFDLRNLKVVGGPVPIIEGVMRSSATATPTSTGNFDLSKDGTLAYVPSSSGFGGQWVLGLVDRNGKTDVLKLPPGPYGDLRVSPDGKQLAVTIVDETSSIGIYNLSGTSSLRRLTLEGSNSLPRWSPDGRQLAFSGRRGDKNGIFLQNVDGTGTPEQLITASPTDFLSPWSWSPDGKILAYTLCKNLLDCGIFTVALAGERKVETFIDLPVTSQYNAAFSPDGRWMAYVSRENAQIRVWVQQYPSGARYQISRENSDAPVWAPDGKELFYVQTDNLKLVAVRIQTQPSFSFSDPVPLPIDRIIQAGGVPRQYDIMPDGKRFLVLLPAPQTGSDGRSTQQINVVLNWFTELKQRVPVK